MRTGSITLNGTPYTLCLSTRVLANLEDRTGKAAGEALAEVMENPRVTDVFWLLHQMILAGAKYDGLLEAKAEPVPTLDELLDNIGLDDYASVIPSIVGAVQAGSETKVETRKNSKASRGK